MVAVKPGLREVVEPMVGGDFIRRQVTVIVVDGHFLCVLVVKNSSGFGLQEKIFSYKFRHFCLLSRDLWLVFRPSSIVYRLTVYYVCPGGGGGGGLRFGGLYSASFFA